MKDKTSFKNPSEEIRMYSDRIDNKSGATIKTCNRLKSNCGQENHFLDFI